MTTYEWDDDKEAKNRKEHKVRFTEAAEVLEDVDACTFFDDRFDYDEERFITIGRTRKLNILLVVWCEQINDIIRIISARKANKKEVRDYEKRL